MFSCRTELDMRLSMYYACTCIEMNSVFEKNCWVVCLGMAVGYEKTADPTDVII